jgi:hypothetical protein
LERKKERKKERKREREKERDSIVAKKCGKREAVQVVSHPIE